MDFQSFISIIENRSFPLEFPGHWLAGTWQKFPGSKALKASINPSNGEELLTPSTDKHIYSKALDSSEIGLQKLAHLNLNERLEILKKFRQALGDFQKTAVDCLRIQSGKPSWEAQNDFDLAIKYLDSFCEDAKTLEQKILSHAKMTNDKGELTLSPVGTAVAFLPFSTPCISFAKYFSAAVFAGCPLIITPSSHASFCGLLFSYIAESIELPEGALNIIFGNFDTLRKNLSDRRIQAIFFTGSREHCEVIRNESESVKGRQLVIQSGGKNATLVHSSADLEIAVKCVMYGAFKSSGQLCTSTSRVFVHKSLRQEFCEQLVDKVQAYKYGATDTDDNHIFMGPMYSKKAVEKFLRYQIMAHREAEKDLMWGKHLEGPEGSCLVSPGIHLMKEFDSSSSYQANVLFCPDLAIYEYDVLDDAIEMVNATDAPFCTSFIGDPDILKDRRTKFVAPNLLINLPTVEVESTPAICGKFHSGHHRYNGIGLALLLTYPHLLRTAENSDGLMESFNW